MNFFDLIFIIIIIGFLILSFIRGSFREVFSTFGVLAGYYAAERFSEKYLSFTLQYIQNVNQARIVTYLGIFVIGIVIGLILFAFFRLFYSSRKVSLPSRILGGIFGLIKATVVCLVIFHIVDGYVPSFVDDLYASFFTPWLQQLRNLVIGINFAFLNAILA